MTAKKNAFALGLGVAFATSASFASALDGESIIQGSILKSSACGGSCVALLKTDSQIFLEVHNPQTGELFQIIPLDLDKNASIGDFASTNDSKAPAKFGGTPGAPAGGTGVVQDSSPFADNQGDGILYVFYTYNAYVLVNVQVVKIYVHQNPA
ncbi:MAG TPA: hypothetical protein VGC30_09735 [Dokdonella sp.]